MLSINSASKSSVADVLTWKTPRKHIRALNVDKFTDISVTLNVRPVFRKHALTEEIVFALPNNFKTSRTFKAEIKAANSGEETSNRQFPLRVHKKFKCPLQSIYLWVYIPSYRLALVKPDKELSETPSRFLKDGNVETL